MIGRIVRGIGFVCFGLPCAAIFIVAMFVGGFLPALPFLLWGRAVSWGVLRLIPELAQHEDVLNIDMASREYRQDAWAINEDRLLVGLVGLAAVWLAIVFFRDGYDIMVLWVYPLFWMVGTILMLVDTAPLLTRHRFRTWILNELWRRGVPICTTCGYPTRGVLGTCCPECGNNVQENPTPSATLLS